MSTVIVASTGAAQLISAQSGDVQVVTAETGAAQVVTAGTQGPMGPEGPGAAQITLQAGTTISADTAVAVVNGQVFPASSSNMAHFGNVVGIAANGGQVGTDIVINQSGEMSLSSWNWTLGQPVFVGTTGPLTQTRPASGFVQIVGIPTSSNSIAVGLQPPVSLS